MTPEPAQPAESPEARAREALADAYQNAGVLPRTVEVLRNGGELFADERLTIAAMLAFAASTARPTERGAVEEARDKCRADVERLTANLERENRRWMPTRAHYEGARNNLRLAANALETALALPATDQAAEVEALRAFIHNDAILFGQIEQRMRECWIGTGSLCDDGSASNDFRVWMNEAHNRQRDLKAALGQNPNTPLAALALPATDQAAEVERDIAGETVCGFRVAAWRETHPEHGDAYGHTYSEHWSTPNTRNPKVRVERLFTETQLVAALATQPATGRTMGGEDGR